MLCPPFGTGVDILLGLRDMASDKTSSSGRLASRGTYVVIASFTPPIHFHSSLSAQQCGGRHISISEAHY